MIFVDVWSIYFSNNGIIAQGLKIDKKKNKKK